MPPPRCWRPPRCVQPPRFVRHPRSVQHRSRTTTCIWGLGRAACSGMHIAAARSARLATLGKPRWQPGGGLKRRGSVFSAQRPAVSGRRRRGVQGPAGGMGGDRRSACCRWPALAGSGARRARSCRRHRRMAAVRVLQSARADRRRRAACPALRFASAGGGGRRAAGGRLWPAAAGGVPGSAGCVGEARRSECCGWPALAGGGGRRARSCGRRRWGAVDSVGRAARGLAPYGAGVLVCAGDLTALLSGEMAELGMNGESISEHVSSDESKLLSATSAPLSVDCPPLPKSVPSVVNCLEDGDSTPSSVSGGVHAAVELRDAAGLHRAEGDEGDGDCGAHLGGDDGAVDGGDHLDGVDPAVVPAADPHVST